MPRARSARAAPTCSTWCAPIGSFGLLVGRTTPRGPSAHPASTPFLPSPDGSEFRFVRERLTPESIDSIEACRQELALRVDRCQISCDACKAECTSEAARQIVSAWKCSFGIPGLGLAVAFHSSDIGVDISHRYGAKRTEGRPAVPDTSYREMYHTMVQNNVDAPIAPRNCMRMPPNRPKHARLPTRWTRVCSQHSHVAALTKNRQSGATTHHSTTAASPSSAAVTTFFAKLILIV